MADEAKQEQEAQKGEETPAEGKGGIIKYAIFGAVGVVLALGVAFGTLALMGGESEPAVETAETAELSEAPAETHVAEEPAEHHEADDGEMSEDSILALLEAEESVFDMISQNLEALDFVPTEAELGTEDGRSIEDSIKEADWISQEKKRLTEWDSELTAREKKLAALDNKLSQQITRIEQVESSRISKLAKLYDGMDSRSVAKLMANLDDETVVSLLPRMKAKSASSVLALMPPVRAARLSKQMITIADN